MATEDIELLIRQPRGSRYRLTFQERFENRERRFAAAYEDGVERLAAAVEAAVEGERDWETGLSAGLRAGLELLAADPPLARLLLVESLAAPRPVRLAHERTLGRLAAALRSPGGPAATDPNSQETTRLLAGGLASHLSRRVLAGEAERLADSHGLLLDYLLASTSPTAPRFAAERRAAGE